MNATAATATARATDASSYIRRVLNLLHEPGAVVEMRCLKTRWGTVSGYFNDLEKLSVEAAALSGEVPSVYITLNPVNPALLARANNRVEKYAKSTTGDSDIIKRCWLPIDFDPVRPSDISSTDAEKALAMERAKECRAWLTTLGLPAGVFSDSGNGAHLLDRIDLPNDQESSRLIQRCLEAIAARFTDDKVLVDLKNFNAARIWKLYGTLACKGDNMPDRPHRLARILEGKSPGLVSVELLQKLAALAPEPQKHQSTTSNGHYQTFNLDDFIARHAIAVKRESAWNGGRRFILDICPWNPDHNRGEAFVVEMASGALAAGCQHNSCAGKGWAELRELYEPGYRDRADRSEAQRGNGAEAHHHEQPRQRPKPTLKAEALHGLAGEVVRSIGPYTEAHDVALLLNTLAAFGSVAGCSAFATVQMSEHPGRLFIAQVGPTSKGRKDTGWSPIKYLFSLIDPDWSKNRIKTGLSSGEGLVFTVRDPIYKQEPVKEKGRVIDYQEVMVDPGESDKRLLL